MYCRVSWRFACRLSACRRRVRVSSCVRASGLTVETRESSQWWLELRRSQTWCAARTLPGRSSSQVVSRLSARRCFGFASVHRGARVVIMLLVHRPSLGLPSVRKGSYRCRRGARERETVSVPASSLLLMCMICKCLRPCALSLC